MAEKQKILIVDDDANIAELISLYLEKECFETQIVGDGEEALRVFPVFKPVSYTHLYGKSPSSSCHTSFARLKTAQPFGQPA